MDLQAAEGGGAQGVGVITGIFTRDQLAAVSPGAQNLYTLPAHLCTRVYVRCSV